MRVCITHIAVTKAIKGIVAKLGGVLVNDPAEADVLVTDALQRTIKFLCALSQAPYIVNELFLRDSGRLGRWVSMDDPGAAERYTLRDMGEEKKHGVTLPAILKRRSVVPFHIFRGWTVHVVGSVSSTPGPSQAQLLQLVAAGGGTGVKTKPSRKADASHLLVMAEGDKRSSSGVPSCVPVVQPAFVIESMFRLSLQWKQEDLILHAPPTSEGAAAATGDSASHTPFLTDGTISPAAPPKRSTKRARGKGTPPPDTGEEPPTVQSPLKRRSRRARA
jgi:hypothetical protein